MIVDKCSLGCTMYSYIHSYEIKNKTAIGSHLFASFVYNREMDFVALWKSCIYLVLIYIGVGFVQIQNHDRSPNLDIYWQFVSFNIIY